MYLSVVVVVANNLETTSYSHYRAAETIETVCFIRGHYTFVNPRQDGKERRCRCVLWPVHLPRIQYGFAPLPLASGSRPY